VQLQDAKRQLEETNKQHDQMVKALKSASVTVDKNSDSDEEETLE